MPQIQRAAADADETVVIRCALSPGQAWALAQLVKRIGWSDCRALAVDEGETSRMIAAAEQLRSALAEVGYAPR